MPHIHWVASFLLSYILRDVSFAEVGRVYRVGLREPIHLCTCVNEEQSLSGYVARTDGIVVYYESIKRELWNLRFKQPNTEIVVYY